ncbi:hypothetical protein C8R43DRAFT_241205 [Mycena crocata]|nr:hypothetical protein C8R43DRAFT_241205 [Mycena crocata]
MRLALKRVLERTIAKSVSCMFSSSRPSGALFWGVDNSWPAFPTFLRILLGIFQSFAIHTFLLERTTPHYSWILSIICYSCKASTHFSIHKWLLGCGSHTSLITRLRLAIFDFKTQSIRECSHSAAQKIGFTELQIDSLSWHGDSTAFITDVAQTVAAPGD